MLELLRSLEWCVGGYCPKCEMSRGAGHSSDCRLDLAIRELASGESDVEYCLRAGPSYPVEPTVDEPIRIGSIVRPKPVPYKGTVWRVDRIERGRAYMTRVDRPDADYPVEAVFPVEDVVAAEPTVDEMARQVDTTIAGKRVGPWLTPPAPKVYEASGPPPTPPPSPRGCMRGWCRGTPLSSGPNPARIASPSARRSSPQSSRTRRTSSCGRTGTRRYTCRRLRATHTGRRS